MFQKYSEYERIEKFSRPKVLRLLEILRIFRPPVPVKLTEATDVVKANDSAPSEELMTTETPKISPETQQPPEALLNESGPTLFRPPTTQPLHTGRRRRPDFSTRHHRNREDAYQLCGIIFTERRTTAKLLYHLLKVFIIQFLYGCH